jgi:hypothetical protein
MGAQFAEQIHLVDDSDTMPCASGLNGRVEQVPIPGADNFGLSRDRRRDDQIIVRILRLDGRGGHRCHDQGTRLHGL